MIIDDNWEAWFNCVGDKYAVGFNRVSFEIASKLTKLFVDETLAAKKLPRPERSVPPAPHSWRAR